MPQPLSKVAPDSDILIGNIDDRPLARHPQLAVLAIEAIASWSNAECYMLDLFIRLFGGNALAREIYLALEIQSQKSAAIQTVAKTILESEPEQLRLLQAILAVAKTNEKARNKLAHWTWGDTSSLPDALLLVNPKVILARIDQSQIIVYREQDFNDIVDANNRLCRFVFEFGVILLGHYKKEELFDRICAEPEIRERLDRQA